MSIVSALVVATVVGAVSAHRTLASRISEGEVLFGEMGLRYFDALRMAHDEADQPSSAPSDWRTYRTILKDIHEDIRALRTNPLYRRIRRDDVVFLQNRIVRELEAPLNAVDLTTLGFMCGAFIHSGELSKSIGEGQLTEDVYGFAITTCAKVAEND